MKQLREYIRKEIKRISEEGMRSFPIPPEVRTALEKDLGLRPLVRYVSTLKAAATVPPSYRVFLINNQFINLYLEEIGIRAEINNRLYWLHDIREANEAKKALNKVLTDPIPVKGKEGDSEDSGDDLSDDPGTEEPLEEPEA